MTSGKRPRVGIGLPVYNGENFLCEAIESILAQTFEDFELIISDNASTDATEEISRSYAAREPRIRYVRNPENIGGDRNFNQAFRLSSSEYFKWAAHDDLHEADFLLRCVEALDRDPSIVLAYTRAVTLHGEGGRSGEWGAGQGLESEIPHERFREALAPRNDPLPLPIFGVARAEVLRRSRLFRKFSGSDRALVAELTLYGKFREVPEVLFLQRNHERRVGPLLASKPGQPASWWDPLSAGRITFPAWRMLDSHLFSAIRAPLVLRERARCVVEVGRWLGRNRGLLLRDLRLAGERLPVIGWTWRKSSQAAWVRSVRRAAKEIRSLIPAKSTIILADQGAIGDALFAEGQCIPFLERDGRYWGCPPDDETALREFDRLHRSGADFMVFGWPAFWWLDSYAGLSRHLRSTFRCILENERLIVFDLRVGGR